MCFASSCFGTEPLNIIKPYYLSRSIESWRNNQFSYCLVSATFLIKTNTTIPLLYYTSFILGLYFRDLEAWNVWEWRVPSCYANLVGGGWMFFSAPCNAVKGIVGQTIDKAASGNRVAAHGDHSPSHRQWILLQGRAQILETTAPLVKHRLGVTANLSWWSPCTM